MVRDSLTVHGGRGGGSFTVDTSVRNRYTSTEMKLSALLEAIGSP